jgi:glycosyltransferase involved in cell wall biosynthesis
MKITITTPAKFPAAFAAARYHERRGELERILSPVPRARSRRFGVSDARNSGIAPLGAWNYGFQRFGPRALQQQHQLAFSAAFDEAASRMLGDCDVVNAWCSTALRTIRTAHKRGIPAVLEVASAHILAQTRLLRDEYARFGGDIDRAVITPGVIERTLYEYEEADRIIVTSGFVKRTFVERGIDAGKIVVVPYGVDAHDTATRTEKPAPRGSGRVPRVLFVGGCSLRKGIPYLVEAFRRVDARAELRLVGRTNDPLFRRIGGLPHSVEAVGPKTGAALAAEYAAADVFVLPSVEDGWGLVTNEAMAAGLPVIVSDHAGSAEIVRDGVNGFVVPARDVDALAERMNALLADAELRARMGAAARETAVSRTWDTYGEERTRLVYEPLLSERGLVVRDLAA